MPVTLENPGALALLILLPALYFLGRGRLSLMSPRRGRAILFLRLAATTALILALAGPSVPLRDATMSVAFVMDSSASLSPATRAAEEGWVHQAIGQMRQTDRAAIVRFDGEPQEAKPLGTEKQYQLPPAGEPKGGSDVAAALRMAAGRLPASGLRKVVLLSDGWDTSGKVEDTARSLPEGTRVDVVPWPAMDGQPEVLIESVDVPSYIREGDGFDISTVVGSNHEGNAQLRVLLDGQQTGSWDVQLGRGSNLVTMPQKALPLGYHSVEVQLSAEGDTIAENNRSVGSLVVKQKGRVLLVEGHSQTGGYLRQVLEGSGLSVDQIPSQLFPIQMPALLSYDAVVLDDVPGPNLSLDQMKTLQSYVRDQGHGLLVVGGQSSYGLGDYISGPLEEMLPVSSDTPLSRDRGDMALILLIDKSGSMDDSADGVTKIAMAREAAIQATQALKPGDLIAVIAFDNDPVWIVEPQKVGNDLNDIRSRISSLQASGGTDIYSALKAAYGAMQGMKATTRHITLLTDGQSWKGQYQQLLQRYQQDQITLSTIGVGEDADQQWLSELSQLGNGRFYYTARFADIPRIVYREVSAATKVAEVDGKVNPQFVAPSPILRGMNGSGIPSLDGYVATKPKDAATIILKSSQGDPLLAQWQYGLGRVVSWTSDAEGLWSASWLTNPEFNRMWDQAVRWSMAPPVNRELQVATKVVGNEATITVDSVDRDGRFIDLADTRVTIKGPDGQEQTIPLRQVAPGRYQAAIPATRSGLYRLEASQTVDGQSATETAGFAVPEAPEFQGLGSNDILLKELAAMTGGRALRDPSQAFSRTGMPSVPGWESLWPYLISLALLLLPLEVALRRIRALPFGRRRAVEEPGSTPSSEEVEAEEGAAA